MMSMCMLRDQGLLCMDYVSRQQAPKDAKVIPKGALDVLVYQVRPFDALHQVQAAPSWECVERYATKGVPLSSACIQQGRD